MHRATFLTALTTLAIGVGALARSAAAQTTSDLRDTVELFTADRQALLRRYAVDYSPTRRDRLRAFHREWQARLGRAAFDRLNHEGKIDYVLLSHRVRNELDQLDREEQLFAEMAPRVPFAETVIALEERRRRLEPVDSPGAAATLARLARQVDSMADAVRPPEPAAASSGSGGAGPADRKARIVALRSAAFVDDLVRTLGSWHRFYAGYDPLFTWWTADPQKRADAALRRYARRLREVVVGYKEGEDEPIVGDPIGAGPLQADLRSELIAYTPQEILAIAEREFAWCEAEMRKAARELGFGDDWKGALEKVKQSFVEPGKQPELVRQLAREAESFVEQHDLVTVPPLAREVWRMEMMTPEAQLVSPFFLGGEVIRVSYPTDAMEHDDKLMSMRGNNPFFSRATVQHELIPGHHLQGFMTSRYNSHRQAFSTPFWGEGWALYWEMLLWDLGFPRTPEERVGMLFWRSHRAARIMFSLGFHLGTMTPEEAIDLLVNRVGHERANATAEVRRSFNGSYPPLYQAAYMLGGLQFRALHRELVGSGRMTNREFHDAILRGGRMPVEMVRVRLTGVPLTRDYEARWRF
jgi:uncharacterized protein (DUF885 family)